MDPVHTVIDQVPDLFGPDQFAVHVLIQECFIAHGEVFLKLIFSGTIFALTGPAKTVSDLTIAKWGQRVLNIEANLNELPSELLDSEIEMINEQEEINQIREMLPPDYVEQFDEALYAHIQEYLHEKTYRKIYEYKPELVLKRWGYLVIFTLIYGLICVISMEFIARDKR